MVAHVTFCCPTARFRLGEVVVTMAAVIELETAAGQSPADFLVRHVNKDWGDVCAEDAKLNDEAVAHEGDSNRQGRVLSAYRTSTGERLWIITEWDRSVTTILLPEEY